MIEESIPKSDRRFYAIEFLYPDYQRGSQGYKFSYMYNIRIRSVEQRWAR